MGIGLDSELLTVELDGDVLRNDVTLLELLSMGIGLDSELLTVELDGDVLGAVLLHVESELVLVTLLDLEENRGLSHLGGGGRDIVLGLADLVIHLRGWRHWWRGHGVLWLAGGGASSWHGGHVRHLLEAESWH